MKIIKYIDFSVQSLLFVNVLIIAITGDSSMGLLRVLLGMQLTVGSWQMLSSVISVGLRFPLYRLKKIHLISCAIYVTILFVFPFDTYSRDVMLAAFTVPAWCLAIFYYIVSTLATFQRPVRQSSFLPHTSF